MTALQVEGDPSEVIEVKEVENGISTDFSFTSPPEYGIQHVGIQISSFMFDFTTGPKVICRGTTYGLSECMNIEARISPPNKQPTSAIPPWSSVMRRFQSVSAERIL